MTRRVWLSADGKVGFALDPHGDLENLFNAGGPPGAGTRALFKAIDEGARTLDAYAPFLPGLYAQAGSSRRVG